MSIVLSLGDRVPKIEASAFVAATATIIGSVTVSAEASIWFGAVLRAENNTIHVGPRSNIQDLSVLHVDAHHALRVGSDVTVGHRAILHGCTIGDRSLIGMGAIVMNGATIGAETLVGSGSVVTEGTEVPPRSLVIGVPARVKRTLTDDEVAGVIANAAHYVKQAAVYR